MNSTIKNIGIMFGGKSPEHEVSVITGLQVLNQIDKEKYNPIPIYVAKDGKWYYSEDLFDPNVYKTMERIPFLSTEVFLHPKPQDKQIMAVKSGLFGGRLKIKLDAVFPCFHGSYGENGAFQGLFEMAEIPYVGSEILGSALGIDKIIGKVVYEAKNIPTAPYLDFHKKEINNNLEDVVKQLEEKINYPMFIKPAIGGSSIGISKASNQEQLKNGLEVAAMFDSCVIVEEGIENAKEINVSVMGNPPEELLVSECEEVFHEGEFLTYEDKYKGKEGKSQGMASTKRKIPADLTAEEKELVQKRAKEVFKALNCYGLARIDFLVTKDPLEAYVIEINTIPGSMSFYLWEASNTTFSEMVTHLIKLAEKRFEEKSQNTYTFDSNILEDFEGSLKSPKIGQ